MGGRSDRDLTVRVGAISSSASFSERRALTQTRREATGARERRGENGACVGEPAYSARTQLDRKERPLDRHGRTGEEVVATMNASADTTRMQRCRRL
jgi:hypothetical protein